MQIKETKKREGKEQLFPKRLSSLISICVIFIMDITILMLRYNLRDLSKFLTIADGFRQLL